MFFRNAFSSFSIHLNVIISRLNEMKMSVFQMFNKHTKNH